MRAGRAFEDADAAGSPLVVIVSQGMADALWPEQNPIGRALRRFDDAPPLRVVGVVDDVKHVGLDRESRPTLYVPLAQSTGDPRRFASMFLVVRTDGDPLSWLPSLRDAVWSVDREVPVTGVRTAEGLVSDRMGSALAVRGFLVVFSLLALVLGVGGVYGVTAYAMTGRQRETGIRLALGATPEGVLRHALDRALRPVWAGLALGVLVAWMASRVLAGVLFGVPPTDPATWVGAAVVLCAASTVAALVPALRASRQTPSTVLSPE